MKLYNNYYSTRRFTIELIFQLNFNRIKSSARFLNDKTAKNTARKHHIKNLRFEKMHCSKPVVIVKFSSLVEFVGIRCYSLCFCLPHQHGSSVNHNNAKHDTLCISSPTGSPRQVDALISLRN